MRLNVRFLSGATAGVGRLQPFRDRTLTLLDRNNLAPVPSFIPFGAPFFKDLAHKTKSSSSLWDPCGTFYPQPRVTGTEYKRLAGKTRSSVIAVGPSVLLERTGAAR